MGFWQQFHDMTREALFCEHANNQKDASAIL